jgi:hypothetical protein
MARDPYIEQRLINWARWKLGRGAGGLGFAGVNWNAFMAEDRDGTAPVLPDDEDPLTDMAVQSLATDVQDALFEQYGGRGTDEAKAQRSMCHVKTFRSRVEAGLRGVSRWLADREAKLLQERARVEAVQRWAAGEPAPADGRPALGGDWLQGPRVRK